MTRDDRSDRATAAGPPARSRTLVISPWWDPHLAVVGHDPLGGYTEAHWLPVLGPSALLALRWLCRRLGTHPQGLEVDHRLFAKSLGLGTRSGNDSPAVRCLDRLCYFDLARQHADAAGTAAGTAVRHLEVRTHVPAIPAHLQKRLPPGLREATAPGETQ